MLLTTSKGKTFDISWMWGPVGIEGDLWIQYKDSRPISEIAKDFDDVDIFHRESETEGDLTFEGYTVIKSIIRPSYRVTPDIVQITLTKPY